MYDEEEFLQLSGVQHFKFCRRQWALIHIEQQWAESGRTVEGALMHERAHDAQFEEARGSTFIVRGVSVFSRDLGISGKCDVVEFHQSRTGVALPRREGLWVPFPVEYKRGKPKEDTMDLLQLCGQALCLEEMLCCAVPEGALYYGEVRRRQTVQFTQALRLEVQEAFEQMHALAKRGHTPKVKPTKACNACSLKEICLPKLMTIRPVGDYLREHMEEAP